MPAVLTNPLVRISFIVLIALGAVFSVTTFSFSGDVKRISETALIKGSSLAPDVVGTPARYYSTESQFHDVGTALYIIGLLITVAGVAAVGFNKSTGYLVSLGGAVLGGWGMWLAESSDAFKGALMVAALAVNALILVPSVESLEKSTGRSLLTRRTISTSLVITSVLSQAVLAALLFQNNDAGYVVY